MRYGGTYIGKDVYLSNQHHYTFTSFEKLFHAEFSSILYHKNQKKFDSKTWQALNPKGFKYSGDGSEYLQSINSKYDSSKDKLYFKQCSLEIKLYGIILIITHLYEKLELAIKFYHSLDPMFTKEYFKNL